MTGNNKPKIICSYCQKEVLSKTLYYVEASKSLYHNIYCLEKADERFDDSALENAVIINREQAVRILKRLKKRRI